MKHYKLASKARVALKQAESCSLSLDKALHLENLAYELRIYDCYKELRNKLKIRADELVTDK